MRPKQELHSYQEVLDFCHYLLGFTDAEPAGFSEWMDLRTTKYYLESQLDKSLLPVGLKKYKAKKSDWCQALLSMPHLQRRQLLKSYPNIVPLFPRDLKALGLDGSRPDSCGTRTFNPGRRIQFEVYSAYKAIAKLLTPVPVA